MANRIFEQFSLSLIKKKVDICGVISLSALGAVVSNTIDGAATVTKTGTGAYLITLSDAYPSLKAFHLNIAETAEDLRAVPGAASSSAKTYVFTTKTAAGVSTDPTATCKVYVSLVLSNSSV